MADRIKDIQMTASMLPSCPFLILAESEEEVIFFFSVVNEGHLVTKTDAWFLLQEECITYQKYKQVLQVMSDCKKY